MCIALLTRTPALHQSPTSSTHKTLHAISDAPLLPRAISTKPTPYITHSLCGPLTRTPQALCRYSAHRKRPSDQHPQARSPRPPRPILRSPSAAVLSEQCRSRNRHKTSSFPGCCTGAFRDGRLVGAGMLGSHTFLWSLAP